MSSREIVLWIDDRWYDALSRHLKDETVEDKLAEYLDTLISQLPEREYKWISSDIWQEQQRNKEEQEASRKYTVFHIRENREDHYLQLDRGAEFMNAARLLRSCLRSGGGGAEYMRMLDRPEEITADQFHQMVATRMEDTGRVTEAIELDFDFKQCSVLNIINGWMVYDMKDVSTAVYHAYRKQDATELERRNCFSKKLDGKALAYHPVPHSNTFLTGCRRLRPNDIFIVEEEDIVQNGKMLEFTVIVEDPEDVFSLTVDRDTTDDFICVYANYDMEHRCVSDMLEVYLDRGTMEHHYQYKLSADEQYILLTKMDASCRLQTGQSLAKYSAQLVAEEMKPPTEQTM